MEWIEAIIRTSSEEIDSLCQRLEEYELSGLVIEDEADFLDFLENNRQYWDYVDEELSDRFKGVSRIKFYLANDDEGRGLAAKIGAELKVEIESSIMADSDWENSWQRYYRPIEIGERIIIVPEWEKAPKTPRQTLRLNPGLIFGTGSHATTRMCLEALEKCSEPGKTVLDLGCGSGILAIASLVLGCDRAVGCDIDPKAPDVAASNAGLNGIGSDRFKVYAGDILTDAGLRERLGRSYDIVLANIVADVIIPLSGLAEGFMADDGLFICSGIIEGRQDEVGAAIIDEGLEVIGHKCSEDWHCFVCRLKKA